MSQICLVQLKKSTHRLQRNRAFRAWSHNDHQPVNITPFYAAKVSNVGNIPCMFFVSEAKLRDTKHIVGIISICYFDNKHILNAQSEAQDI